MRKVTPHWLALLIGFFQDLRLSTIVSPLDSSTR
jgi:hypothetical protein